MRDFEFNKDYNLRDQIIFGEPYNGNVKPDFKSKSFDDFLKLVNKYYSGGVRRFDELTIEKLKELIDKKFIDEEEQQNEGPTIKKFLAVASKIKENDSSAEIFFHGYAVSPDRDDYRVSIDAITVSTENYNIIVDKIYEPLREMCSNADDLDIDENELYAWWD